MKQSFFAQQLREHNNAMRVFLKDYMRRTLDAYIAFCEAGLTLTTEEKYNFGEFKHAFSACLAELKNATNDEKLYKKVSDVMSLAAYYDNFFSDAVRKILEPKISTILP